MFAICAVSALSCVLVASGCQHTNIQHHTAASCCLFWSAQPALSSASVGLEGLQRLARGPQGGLPVGCENMISFDRSSITILPSVGLSEGLAQIHWLIITIPIKMIQMAILGCWPNMTKQWPSALEKFERKESLLSLELSSKAPRTSSWWATDHQLWILWASGG